MFLNVINYSNKKYFKSSLIKISTQERGFEAVVHKKRSDHLAFILRVDKSLRRQK